MPLTPEQLAAEVKRSIEKAEDAAGVPRGAIAYLITLDAGYCAVCSDIEFCALVEHELYHIGQKMEFGLPAFTREGLPKLGIRGHDVEEFTGIVRRYGVGHPEGTVAQMVEAARRAPEVGRLNIAQACGTCMLKVA